MSVHLIRCVVLSVLLIIFTPVNATSQCEGIELMRTGQFHSGEVTECQAGEWLGLVETPTGWELRQVQVSVEPAFDAMGNDNRDDPSTWTGWDVSAADDSAPLFLVRGLKDMEIGRVNTLFVGHTMVCPESPLFLGHPGSHVSLRAVGTRADNGYQVLNYTLSLWVGWAPEMRSQELISTAVVDPVEDSIEVLWVGDLDADGRADVLLDTGNHYNVVEYSLFLSSCAEEDDLVAHVARFRSVGC